MTRNDILDYVSSQYGTDPDYPWATTPSGAVLRHRGNKKWYGLIMSVKPKSLGLTGSEEVDILNLKCDHRIIGDLIHSGLSHEQGTLGNSNSGRG